MIDEQNEFFLMNTLRGIYGIRILDSISGLIVFQKLYTTEESESIYPESFYSTIIFPLLNESQQDQINIINLTNRKVYIEKSENLVFIVIAKPDYESQAVKRILSHIRVTFLRKYPIRDCDWQFDGSHDYFQEFDTVVDDIIKHFGDTKVLLKIVLMGLDFAGKTTLTHAYSGSRDFKQYIPTTGLDILRIEYLNTHIRIWDLGGQTQFRTLWPKFATEASGIIFVIDSTSSRWVENKDAFEIAKLFHIPIIIFANKQDLTDRAVSLDTIAAKLGVAKTKIIKGSALLNEGVFETLNLLLQDIFEQRSLS